MGKTDYENKLQQAIRHARRDPELKAARIAALNGVNATTLRRGIAGKSRDYATAARDKQLFTMGEEKAITEHIGTMADCGFPLTHKLLQQTAQDMLNLRDIQRNKKLGDSSGTTLPPTHIVGKHWVDRFLERNEGFKSTYIWYQERARVAASNDVELQADFLRKLDNLVQRKKIMPENLWNCDEKGLSHPFKHPDTVLLTQLGITMGRNTTRTMAIVRAGGRSNAMTEGSREFCSVLETVSAAGVAIPPFIVWQGKTHWQSYYPQSGVSVEATFAVTESGYMDDDLGLQYMKTHFDPYTRNSEVAIKTEDSKGKDTKYHGPARGLIVDGHSSHIAWRVIQYALDNNIHMICLPSKSTHLLQPLDVGCFGVLQTTYEKNLSAWLRENPLSVISKPSFLGILNTTRSVVYTTECITRAWRKSRCWPINRKFDDPDTAPIGLANVLDNVSMAACSLDTPSRMQALTKRAEGIIQGMNSEDRETLFEVIDFAIQKVTKYRDIMPRAETLMKLRNGKVRREKRTKSRRVGGEAHVLTYQHVNDGLQKLEREEIERRERQLLAEARKRSAEEKKTLQETLIGQWKSDIAVYNSVVLLEWRMECIAIDTEWAAAKQLKVKGRRPPYPPRPKRPLKPKDGRDLGYPMSGEVPTVLGNAGIEDQDQPSADDSDSESESEELLDSINSLRIGL